MFIFRATFHCERNPEDSSLVGLSALDDLSHEFQQSFQSSTELYQFSNQSVSRSKRNHLLQRHVKRLTLVHISLLSPFLILNVLPFSSVFRSCKLIPTMIVASIVHKKVFSSIEYFCAFASISGWSCLRQQIGI